MAVWTDEIIPALRILINDLGATLTYSDARLEEVCCVAAKMILSENISLGYEYSIIISTHTITPDPVSNNDVFFQNLILLKSACIVDQGNLRTKSGLANISAKMGPASLDTKGHLEGFIKILEMGPCKAYDQLKFEHMFGNSSICKVILSPFVSNVFDPQNLQNNTYCKDRYSFIE